MTSKSAQNEMSPRDRADFGYARVRNAAYEAVQKLWRRRKENGLTQQALAESIGMDPARLSKYLNGPGNWTLRTFGELVEGLDGEAEIRVFGLEDQLSTRPNFHAYADYDESQIQQLIVSGSSKKATLISTVPQTASVKK
jgi:transcriptional regulator with XRE-family HTH domain